MSLASPPELSIVIPVYRNEESLRPLCDQIEEALSGSEARFEVLGVCDDSPDRSWEQLRALAHERPWLIGIRLARNVGQHRAAWIGMQLARGAKVAVLAADLQDPPAALPVMLAHLIRLDADVVFARHTGSYQSHLRMISSRLFKAVRAWLAGVPRGASLNFVLRREFLERLSTVYAPTPFLVSMLGVCGAQSGIVDVRREVRPFGRSGYGGWQRLTLGARELGWTILWKAVPRLRWCRTAARQPFLIAEITSPLSR